MTAAPSYAATGRADVVQVLERLLEARARREALSLVRLGDGEGRLLGYPDFVDKAELDRSLGIWFGRTDFDAAALAGLSAQLRRAVQGADIVGVPRLKQQQRSEYQTVIEAIGRFALIGARQTLTDAAIHRYLQFGLFYRRLLGGLDFCGLVSCRDLAATLQRTFGIARVSQYLIPGEAAHPGPFGGRHFPDRFEELRRTLAVPHPGAVFLVGAGALGKIYCQWIKEAGGIAIDIGSLCDAWASVETRLRHPAHRIDAYRELPSISLGEAVRRCNALCDELGLDAPRPAADAARAAQTFF